MRIAPLTEAEQRHLIGIISDLESGDARQWYWLEIAQTMPSAKPTARIRWLGIATKAFGIATLSPILTTIKVKGSDLYLDTALHLTAYLKHKLNDALLILGSIIGILAGFQLLSASLQFAIWCTTLLGAAWHIIHEIRRTKRQNAIEEIEPNDQEPLPSAESSLGLASILLAAGVSPQLSLTLVKGLKQDPVTFTPPLLLHCPRLKPDPQPSLRQRLWLSGLVWLIPGIVSSKLLGVMTAPWSVLLALSVLACIAFLIHPQRAARMILLATWAGVFALASIAHYL